MANRPTPKMVRDAALLLEDEYLETGLEETIVPVVAWMRERADAHEKIDNAARAARVALHRIAQDLEANL